VDHQPLECDPPGAGRSVAALHRPFPARCPGALPQGPAAAGGAAIRPIFRAANLEEARRPLGETVARLQGRVPKVARLLEEAEPDLLAFNGFPAAHRFKLRSTNLLERVNREIGRRTDVVGVVRAFRLRQA
jgi:transposase-like protein